MSFVLFILAFAFYLSGLNGTIPVYRDSGDLIASIHVLGIAHPPGYALYILLGKLFVMLLPFGNVAYRVNVFSAFCAAGTAAILFKLSRKSNAAMAGMTAILFAVSPAVVSLARVAEMYSLASLLAVGILGCLWSNAPEGHAWAALLLGLSLSVHPILIFLTPLFFVRPPRSPVQSGCFFLIGLTVFLYLPLRAAQHPLTNWGDPSNWRNFWRVVTRADYGGLKLHPEQSVLAWTPESIFSEARYFISACAREWGWPAFLTGAFGAALGIRQLETRRKTAGLLVCWVLSGPAFAVLSNLPLNEPTTPAILQPYLLLPNLLWAFFIVRGLGATLSLRGGFVPTKQSIMTDCFAALAMTSLILLHPWKLSSLRNDFYAYDYARNLLRSLPPGAVLYEPDDPTQFSIQVLQLVEKRRTDIILLNFFRTRWGYEEIKRRWPDLLPPIPIESGQELVRQLWSYSARQRPFFAELPQKLSPIPYRSEGLVYAAHPLPPSGGESVALQRAEALLSLYVKRGDFVTTHHPDFFTSHLISYYSAAENNLGVDYANLGRWREAVDHYRAALMIEPDQKAARNNLAVALQKMPKLL